MAQIVFSYFVLSLTIFAFCGTAESRSSVARVYLQTQCQTAIYHDLCVQTLLPYVVKTKTIPGPQQLAKISLAVCLSKARQTKEYVDMVAKQSIKAKSSQAVQECSRQINNGVNQITLAVKEFQQLGNDVEENFPMHEDNMRSWMSAALTDIDMCVDGILGDVIGGKEKAIMKAKILNVKQLASNSLALLNRYTLRHRASHIVKNP